jgi:hypothetical protein
LQQKSKKRAGLTSLSQRCFETRQLTKIVEKKILPEKPFSNFSHYSFGQGNKKISENQTGDHMLDRFLRGKLSRLSTQITVIAVPNKMLYLSAIIWSRPREMAPSITNRSQASQHPST